MDRSFDNLLPTHQRRNGILLLSALSSQLQTQVHRESKKNDLKNKLIKAVENPDDCKTLMTDNHVKDIVEKMRDS